MTFDDEATDTASRAMARLLPHARFGSFVVQGRYPPVATLEFEIDGRGYWFTSSGGILRDESLWPKVAEGLVNRAANSELIRS